jgi:ferric-dicitrate binding protein FerR (iron transport regulator)
VFSYSCAIKRWHAENRGANLVRPPAQPPVGDVWFSGHVDCARAAPLPLRGQEAILRNSPGGHGRQVMTDCESLREHVFAPGVDGGKDQEWLAHEQVCPECRRAYKTLPLADQALAEAVRLAVTVPSFDAIAARAADAALHQRRRNRVRRVAPFLYSAIGAITLFTGMAWVLLVDRGHRPPPLRLVPGSEMQVSTEAKTAILDSGVRIQLDTGTIRLAPTSGKKQSLVLRSGRVFVEVPKLPAGKSLSVMTPEAEVLVRGTRFQVTRISQETQVQVQEGAVEVFPDGPGRAPQIITAGESVIVPSAETNRENLRSSALDAMNHGRFEAAERLIGQMLATGPNVIQRAEAQALLAWSSWGRGQREQAIERYRLALSLLPDGQRPLWAENACAELAILVQQKSAKDGAAVWAECLRRFPEGAHTGLARARADMIR